MSGSGKPGSTFKATVVNVDGDQILLKAEDAEDAQYFVVGVAYLFHVTAVGGGHGSSGDQS